MRNKKKSVLFCIFVLLMILLVTGCSSSSSNDSKYGKEEYKCAMKSSSTRTCSYSVYSNKCVCKTKK